MYLHIATTVAGVVETSFGPRGSYKMIVYNRGPERLARITKDPVPFLEEMAVQQPIAKIVSEAAKMQRDEIGDGVATFVILLASMLRKADTLMSRGLHPSVILNGYALGVKRAIETIDARGRPLASGSDSAILESVDCGRGIFSETIKAGILESLRIVPETLDLERIKFIKKPGGSIPETYLVEGLIITKEKPNDAMPDRISSPKIALLSCDIGPKRLEIKMPGEGRFPFEYKIEKPEGLRSLKEGEREVKDAAVERIRSSGANAVFSEKPIDDYIKGMLAKSGIFALEKMDRGDMALLSTGTGSRLVGDINDLSSADLGSAKMLEVMKLQTENAIKVTCGDCVTFVLRGATSDILSEIEKNILNAFRLLRRFKLDPRFVPGAGAIEVEMAHSVRSLSLEFGGREQLALEALSEALLALPSCLAINWGLKAVDIIPWLESNHSEGASSWGVSKKGCEENVCLDPVVVKKSAVRRAFEVAKLMLSIDDLILSKEQTKFHKQELS